MAGIGLELRFAREQLLGLFPPVLPCSQFTSVNAKQIERPVFQAGPSRCESGHGCHVRSSNCSQGVISSARRSAKAEVRGANPRESAIYRWP